MMSLDLSAMRPRLIGMVLLALAFLVGGLAGAAFDRVLSAREPAADTLSERCERLRATKQKNLFEQLGVTAEQQEAIDVILERRRHQTAGFWEEAGPRLRAIVDSTRTEIRAVLTPEQREEFDRFRAERRAAKQRAKDRNGK